VAAFLVRPLLALMMLGASVPKLTGDPQMVQMFRDIGGGEPLRLFVGLAEAVGAAGLLVPRFGRLAALGLVTLLAGAGITNVVILHDSPLVPMVLGAAAAFVAWAQRRRR
jgi:putative oxidoreductase